VLEKVNKHYKTLQKEVGDTVLCVRWWGTDVSEQHARMTTEIEQLRQQNAQQDRILKVCVFRLSLSLSHCSQIPLSVARRE
jgi:hypothetical protein